MRPLLLFAICAPAVLLLGGCPAETASPASESRFRLTSPDYYGDTVSCFDSDNSELDGVCPFSSIAEVLATIRLQDEQARAMDIDGDGIPNEIDPDVDGDGEPNKTDKDIDGDGIPNGHDPDADGDGKIGKDDPDEDGDGLSDRFDLNDDGDGLFDDEDMDRDGNGAIERGDDEPEAPEKDDDETQPLDDLVERLRGGQLSDDDRAKIAKEITDRLDNPRVNDIVLKAIQDLGTRADDFLRDNNNDSVPAQIAAVDAVYDQLSKSLRQARREAGVETGDPTPDAAVRKALGEFIPRLQSLDELSKSAPLTSIRDLGLAVSDLRAGLGSPDRVRDFTQALTRSAVNDPLGLDEKTELEKLTTGAALLGSTFASTRGGDLLDSIRLIDGLVDTPDELADALRKVRDKGRGGSSFDDAVNEVVDELIGDIDDGSGGGNNGNAGGNGNP